MDIALLISPDNKNAKSGRFVVNYSKIQLVRSINFPGNVAGKLILIMEKASHASSITPNRVYFPTISGFFF